MLSEPLRYELYGLRHGNPYRIEPLDPLARAGDRALLVDIDGFVSTEALRAYLRESVAAGESAFVVVSGRDYTGRTTIANHVLDVYREVSELDDRLLVSRIKVGHNRDFEWVKEAMVELQNEIEEADLTLSPALTESLNTIEGIDEGVYQSRYRGLARRLHGELAGQARGRCSFGVVFEGLRQTSLVDAMRKVFKSSRSIAVFTHGDYKHANTPSYEELSRLDVHLIKLEPLKGEQVRCLAEERWRAASALPSPFPPDSLETAWPAPTPIKSVVKTLSLLLDIRLGSAADHGPWPDNTELEIPHRFMFFMIRMLNELGAS
ncbi:hypothetical protein ACGFJC_00645 [Nonomuraea fuscirosea]|jgi:hypothetical protein|uniref:Uncharacterized protein n=1 Tax=Nonomuraea fuscirosea TaxID=1291556 RepID=A0A2T0N9R0_9ACTN|nr:hypothetical protein [Nonomuraea fuscirosea]PRX69524.1 hypothetical protein B0I32_102582 [Nonomuraea fuscirosea]WSA49002.1 hypothetical protein OIE67_33595 [Nonomuraea fuscirosea]